MGEINYGKRILEDTLSHETKKATVRRLKEHDSGGFRWRDVFAGSTLDVGSGNDCLDLPNVTPFDVPKDANKLSSYFPADSFSALHGSNIFEHLFNPHEAFGDWLKILKRGGYLCLTVPEAILYGDMLWNSGRRFNLDHKSTWSLFLKGSPAPIHIHVPTFVEQMEAKHGVECLLCRLIDTNYDYKIMFTQDQTWPQFPLGAECFIEMLFIRK